MTEKEYKLKINPRILELLGPHLYTNIYYVLAELIANSYDAGARNVYIINKENEIIVEDDGGGMSYKNQDIKKYLDVAKETRTTEEGSVIEVNGVQRRKMGRKGVGKLAALSVSKKVLVKTIKNNEKSGFVLSREINNSGQLNPLNDNDIVFDKIDKDGTAIVMQDPQYNMHKTLQAIKNNLLKIFPFINKSFRIHIISGTDHSTIDNFDKEMISGLGALITLGDEYKYLSDNYILEAFVGEENKKELLKNKNLFSKSISLQNKLSNKKMKYNLEVKGWIGAYKDVKGRKNNPNDFPDNFISLLSNQKLGEFNILPIVGNNRFLEVYIVGQLHIDLFEETELPDMALINRQGYKADDLRYVEVIKYVKEELLREILVMRGLYADYKNEKRKARQEAAKLKKEQELVNKAREYKEKASKSIVSGLSDFIDKNNTTAKNIIDDAINNTTVLMGIKKEVDLQKKKIFISHLNKENEDKMLSDLICQMLEFNYVTKEDIIYTSSHYSEQRQGVGENLFEYLRNFFVNSMSNKKIFVIYVTSKEMSKSWNPVLEAGAGWITKSKHQIFNIADYKPEEPLDRNTEWHQSKIHDGRIFMDKKGIDLFCEKIIFICKNIDVSPKSKELNQAELIRLGVKAD